MLGQRRSCSGTHARFTVEQKCSVLGRASEAIHVLKVEVRDVEALDSRGNGDVDGARNLSSVEKLGWLTDIYTQAQSFFCKELGLQKIQSLAQKSGRGQIKKRKNWGETCGSTCMHPDRSKQASKGGQERWKGGCGAHIPTKTTLSFEFLASTCFLISSNAQIRLLGA